MCQSFYTLNFIHALGIFELDKLLGKEVLQ